MKRITILVSIQMLFLLYVSAQEPVSTASTAQQKDNAWEIGLHAGHFFSNGNVKFIPGYAGGIHIRRALDYVFSLRLDLMYGAAKGEDDGNVRSFENSWMSGSLLGVISLNNLKWNLGERKTNIYALGGFGLNNFSADLAGLGGPLEIESDVAAHGDIGAGIAFRINNRLNFGIEHKATFVFGERSDWLDGVQTIVNNDGRGTLKDVLNYTSVRLNINLGNLSNKTEPLYWVNPMEGVINDITRLKDTRVTLTDTDGDGVIDMMDDEENTPEGASVNAKGVTLDSDKDGIADYLDKEPFSPSGYRVDAQGVAQLPDPMAEMRKYVDEKLKNFTPVSAPATPSGSASSGIYLPSIYFPQGGSKISNLHFGTLASIAEIIKVNPGLRFVVTGHTDEKGAEPNNMNLSYRRAQAVIEVLTSKFQVSRSQLVLQYKGESELLLPGFVEVNRRVAFRVASGNEAEMSAPFK